MNCTKCNNTGEVITGLDGKEYPGDSGVEPAGGGSIHECTCQETTITNNPFFNEHKLGTKFRNVISGLTYYLSRYTDNKLVGTLFLHCRNDDDVITEANQKEWELAEPVPEDPQALLTRLLECFHDGDRPELLSALTDISNHIRQMHKLPRLSRDTTLSTCPTYIVLPNEEINTDIGTQDSVPTEETREV